MKDFLAGCLFVLSVFACYMTAEAKTEPIDTLSGEWAQVRVSVACFRDAPAHSAQLITQAVMGTPLKLKFKSGQWYYAEMPDGYEGWVVDNSICKKNASELDSWRGAERVTVTSLDPTYIWATPDATSHRERISDAVGGMILEARPQRLSSSRVCVVLPDGREGWIDTACVTLADVWASRTFDPKLILDNAYALEGTPYLWGGTSQKSMDCSGLTRICYFANGILLLRDASQQARTGTRIDPDRWRECRPADLLFFGNPDTGRVTHVALYDNGGDYVHASGMVKRNSLDGSSDKYLPIHFLNAVRIDGNEDTPGIVRMINHPWYFNK